MAGKPRTSRESRPIGRRVVRQRRIAAVLLWTCLSISVASAALWVTSARWTAFWMTQFGDMLGAKAGYAEYLWTSASCRRELIEATNRAMPSEPVWNWHCDTRRIPMEWWPPVFFLRHPTGRAMIAIHLGVPFGMGLIGAFFARRWLRRLPRPGTCSACGYSTHGLPAGVCPECGRPLPPSDCFPQI